MAERRRLGVPVELAGAFGIGFETVLGAGVVGAYDGGVLVRYPTRWGAFPRS
jgi:hypothetical protein